jgi:hypothetical protein
MNRFMAVALALVVACHASDASDASEGSDGPPDACYFASGRPCSVGEVCLGEAGDECNYYTCQDGRLIGGAVGCAPGEVPPVAGGPFDCDPSLITSGDSTPPPSPCPLGGLYTIEDGFFGRCVPVAQCQPLPCNPAFNDDGCPSSYTCDGASSTCQPRL